MRTGIALEPTWRLHINTGKYQLQYKIKYLMEIQNPLNFIARIFCRIRDASPTRLRHFHSLFRCLTFHFVHLKNPRDTLLKHNMWIYVYIFVWFSWVHIWSVRKVTNPGQSTYHSSTEYYPKISQQNCAFTEKPETYFI